MRRDKQVNVALSAAEYADISELSVLQGFPHVTECIRALMRKAADDRRRHGAGT